MNSFEKRFSLRPPSLLIPPGRTLDTTDLQSESAVHTIHDILLTASQIFTQLFHVLCGNVFGCCFVLETVAAKQC